MYYRTGGQAVEKRGMIVERGGETAASPHCTIKPNSNMSRELFDQFGLAKRKGEGFDFSR